MIVCNRCGKENQDHYKFCLGCGAELTAAAKGDGGMAMMKTMMADSPGAPPRPLPGLGPTPSPGSGPMGSGMPLPPPPGYPGAPGPSPLGPPPGAGGAPGPMGGGPMGGGPMGPGPMGGGPMGPGPMGGGPMGGGPMGPGPMGGGPMGGGPMGPAPLGPPPGLGGGPGSGPIGGFGGMPGGPLGGGPIGGSPLPAPAAMVPSPQTQPPPYGAPPSVGPPAGPPPGVPGSMTGGFGSPQPSTGPRRCPQCGNDVPPGFRFCGSCGCRMDEVSQPAIAPAPTPQARPQPRALMTLIRPDGSEGGTHELRQGENKIGRNFGPVFETDGYLSPLHAEMLVNGTAAMVRDLDSLNGVFVKMIEEEELHSGQILRIGQELLRFDLIVAPEPIADGTEVMGSPNPGYWGKLTVIIGKDVDGSAFPLLGDSVTLGRERGEINFPDDGYVSGLHARVVNRDGRVFLSDLGSSNGTFVKVYTEKALTNESFVLMGQQLFRLNLTA